jgi:hypothetical protein
MKPLEQPSLVLAHLFDRCAVLDPKHTVVVTAGLKQAVLQEEYRRFPDLLGFCGPVVNLHYQLFFRTRRYLDNTQHSRWQTIAAHLARQRRLPVKP